MTDDRPTPSPQEEPSVLDWFKAIFSRRPVPRIPELPDDPQAITIKPLTVKEFEADSAEAIPWQFPWRAISALGLVLYSLLGGVSGSADHDKVLGVCFKGGGAGAVEAVNGAGASVPNPDNIPAGGL